MLLHTNTISVVLNRPSTQTPTIAAPTPSTIAAPAPSSGVCSNRRTVDSSPTDATAVAGNVSAHADSISTSARQCIRLPPTPSPLPTIAPPTTCELATGKLSNDAQLMTSAVDRLATALSTCPISRMLNANVCVTRRPNHTPPPSIDPATTTTPTPIAADSDRSRAIASGKISAHSLAESFTPRLNATSPLDTQCNRPSQTPSRRARPKQTWPTQATTNAISGLVTSGITKPHTRPIDRHASHPPPNQATPTSAPSTAWVVATGIRPYVASPIHPTALSITTPATSNWAPPVAAIALANRCPTLAARNKLASDPANVQPATQDSTER